MANGTFAAPVNYNAGSGPVGVITGDFNGDGKIDLGVLANGGVSILLGNGDGTFQTYTSYPVAGYVSSLVAADFYGKKSLDLAVATSLNNYIYFLEGDGKRAFWLAHKLLRWRRPGQPCGWPVGQNGSADLAVANSIY